DDLAEVAVADAADGGGDGLPPGVLGERAVLPSQAGGGVRRGGDGEGFGVVADGGQPGGAVAAAEDAARDDQGGVGGLGVEAEGAEGDGAGAGDVDGVVDVGGGEKLAQERGGGGEAVGAAGDGDAGGLAPAGDALAVADPGQRGGVGKPRDEVARVGDRDGADGQALRCGDGELHASHCTPDLNLFKRAWRGWGEVCATRTGARRARGP